MRASASRFTGRAVDASLLSLMKRPSRFPSAADIARVRHEVERAHALYVGRRGLTDPRAFHGAAQTLLEFDMRRGRHMRLHYELIRFPSAYVPDLSDPVRSRWLSYRNNHHAYAWVLRHPEPDRPWVVCLHGLGTGAPWMDFAGFRAATLHHAHGLNLVFPALPLHGPRSHPGLPRGSLLSYELLDAFHGVTQGVADTRALMQWVRAQGASKVGLYGVSMGAYVGSLTASLEPTELLMVGIPLCDVPGLFAHHAPEAMRPEIDTLLSGGLPELFDLVSPLAHPPSAPAGQRFIFAGTDDCVTTPQQAERLWQHWEQPSIEWFPGGHVSFFWSARVGAYVDESLINAGFSQAEP